MRFPCHLDLKYVAASGVVMWALTSSAAVVTPGVNQSGVYAVSNSDLINGLTPVATGTYGDIADPSDDAFSGTNPGILTDGTFGGASPTNTTTLVAQAGDTVTYTLNTAINTFGYTINSINTFGNWNDNGRDNQDYTVTYTTVSSAIPATIALVHYDPGTTGNSPSDTMVQIFDNSAVPLATGVKTITFTFNSQENGYAGYTEFDVLGAATTPEPASFGILGAGLTAFVLRRRRA